MQTFTALLIGKFFAKKLDIIDDASLGVSEIANELGRPKTALSGRLGDFY